jgi:predicted RNA-binding protein with PIN domain
MLAANRLTGRAAAPTRHAGGMEWVVDGTNVMGSRPDGWWRDRPAARRRLVVQLAELAGDGDPVTVFFDGRPTAAETASADPPDVAVRYATGGPNAADDAIATYVAEHPSPGGVVVVTSDADLVRRVHARGAEVLGSGAFLKRLPVR